MKKAHSECLWHRCRRRLSFFFSINHIICLLRIFGRRNELTMKTCSIFFSFSQLYNNRQRLFFIWTFSALTKQFIPFKITLLFPFRHVFSHIIYGKMICKIRIQMQTHKIRRCTRNEEKKYMNQFISVCRRFFSDSICLVVILVFTNSTFLYMTICVCVCSINFFLFVCFNLSLKLFMKMRRNMYSTEKFNLIQNHHLFLSVVLKKSFVD